MHLRKITFAVTILILATINEGLRVLVFFPVPTKSHSMLGHGIVNELLKAGHEVVHITSLPREKPTSQLKEINIGFTVEKMRAQSHRKLDALKSNKINGKINSGDTLAFLYFAYDLHRQVLEEKTVVDCLNDTKERFDVVILEWFFSDFIAGIAPLFECPLIWFVSTEAHWQILKIIDEIPNPSHSTDLFSLNYPPLTHWERIMELWTVVKMSVMINLFIVPLEKSIYNSIFPAIASKRGVTMPSYNEAIYNGSLLLMNSHPSVGIPFQLPQNAKYIAGYHIDGKVMPLPKNLQTLMDEGKHGIIYFSMGSNLKSTDMSKEMRDSLIKMFAELKQTVIWKFEEDLPDIPSNLYIVKWAPQQSILSHPNLKIFVTHGGQLSTIEAIHFGVPIIGIPVIGDQHLNMRSAVNKGFGLSVAVGEDMAPKLKRAIIEMLGNETYKQRAKQLSHVYHDRIVTPGAELVYWVQHIARTAGAPHLRSPALNIPLYQKLYLDLLIAVVLVLYLIFFCVKILKRTYLNSKALKEKAN